MTFNDFCGRFAKATVGVLLAVGGASGLVYVNLSISNYLQATNSGLTLALVVMIPTDIVIGVCAALPLAVAWACIKDAIERQRSEEPLQRQTLQPRNNNIQTQLQQHLTSSPQATIRGQVSITILPAEQPSQIELSEEVRGAYLRLPGEEAPSSSHSGSKGPPQFRV